MRWTACLALAACWTSPPPRAVSPNDESATERCAPFHKETTSYRGLPQMEIAKAQPLSGGNRWSARPMAGPFANVLVACEGCERQPGAGRYREIAATGKELAVRIDAQWWAIELPINDTCAQ